MSGLVVEAIPLAPPRVSLLTSVDVITNASRWEAGIRTQPAACAPPTDPYWWDCPGENGDPPNYTKDIPDPEAIIDYRPFDIWVGVRCGNSVPRDEYATRADQAMEAFQSHLIERELWSGAVAQAADFPNDYLMNTPVEINNSAATPYVTALAELEQGLAECQPGQTGVIHAQPRTVTLWVQNGLVVAEPNGRRLRTLLGTIVVPGSGYPGTGEGLASATAAASFAYGTGMVRVWLGEKTNLDVDGRGFDHDRATNTTLVRIERSVAAVWDECCQLSVQVDLNTAV